MNSQATSAMAWRRHRSAIAARLVNLREIDRKAFWEFCNTICQQPTFIAPRTAWPREDENGVWRSFGVDEKCPLDS
jgi:hypothetical protein